MKREFSAGGVLVRRLRRRWVFAAIRPAGKEPGLWALPKGQIGGGERPEETAVRYVFTWRGERIFKVVSFYLLRYSRGRLGELPPATAHEVAEVRWLPLEDGPSVLAYKGEREMAERAIASVQGGAL